MEQGDNCLQDQWRMANKKCSVGLRTPHFDTESLTHGLNTATKICWVLPRMVFLAHVFALLYPTITTNTEN